MAIVKHFDPQDVVPRQLGGSAAMDGDGVRKRLRAFDRLGWTGGERLLDVGCGTGSYTMLMAADFEQTVGIDLQTEDLDEFQRRVDRAGLTGIEVRKQSVTSLPYPDEHFDAVTSIECIEHIDDLRKGLSEMARVLRPGGRLYITCPNRLFPIETHAVIFRGTRYSGKRTPFLPWIPPLHTRMSVARTFTSASLRSILRQAGLSPDGRTWIMPPFDHSSRGKYVRPFTDWAERTPVLRAFGVSLVMSATKPG
jgi:ubiquinone/menaquinone biosynthesis C-methylase UbiE